MPYQWTAERERQMLLLAISRANLRPSADTWAVVASLLGGGLSASAVSQKYYKLRNESAKLLDGQPISTPPTPTKRKREGDAETPTKRGKKLAQQENFDGKPTSEGSNSPISASFKTEGDGEMNLQGFPSGESLYLPVDLFTHAYGHIRSENTSKSSSFADGISFPSITESTA